MRGSRVVLLCAAGALAAATGCTRGPNPALVHAQAAYEQANRDPEVAHNAEVAMHEAAQELDRAHDAFEDGEDDVVVEHHAYLVERKVDIARANAQQKVAEDQVAQLHGQRSDVIVQSRTGEASAARAEASAAQQELARLRRDLASLQPRETERGLVLTLSNVVFEFDKATLKPGAQQDLYKIANFLKENPDQSIRIEGHTDSLGSDEYNRELSQSRADAVREFLVRNGVGAGQVQSTGYGEDYPVATNDTEAGRQRNRRVDMVIAGPSQTPTAGVGRQQEPASGSRVPGAGPRPGGYAAPGEEPVR